MSDDLIYKIRLELDEKSREDIEKKVRQLGDEISRLAKGDSTKSKSSDEEASALRKLRQELSIYREELAKVNKISTETGGAATLLRQTQVELGDSIRTTTAQIQEANKGYADQQTILGIIPNTYNELVEQNRALSIAMKNVPLDDTSGRLENLREKYNTNRASLTQFDASMGNFQRNVGNYENSIRSFANALAVVQGPLGPIAGRVNSIATVLSRLNKAQQATNEQQSLASKIWKGNLPLIQSNTTAIGAKAIATRGANTAIKGLNLTLKGLRFALIALGIPALVIGVLSVINAFKASQEGAEKLRVIMAGLSALFNVFTDRSAALGEAIIGAFENPKQAVKDLWETIKQNIVNRFVALPKIFQEGFGALSKTAQAAALAVKGIWSEDAREASRALFAEAAKDYISYVDAVGQLLTGIEEPFTRLADSIGNLIDDIKEKVNEGTDLEKQMNAVLRLEREISVERALQNKELQSTRALARDMDVDSKTRLDAIIKIAEEEGKMLDKELENERERLRILQQKSEMFRSDEKVLDELAQQQIKLADLERASIEKMISLERDKNSVKRQIREQELREERHAFEITERNNEIQFQKLRDRLAEENRLRESLEIDLARIVATKEEESDRLRKLYLTEFLAQKFSQADAERMANEKAEVEMLERISNAESELRKQVVSERKSQDAFDRQIALQRKDFELKMQRDTLLQQNRVLEAARLEELHTTEGQLRLINDLKAQYLAEFIDQGLEPAEAARRAEEKAEIDSAIRIFDAKMNLAELERQDRITKAEIIAKAIGQINQGIFNNNKELAVASTIADTYVAAQKAAASVAPPWNIPLIAGAIAQGIGNVRKILATKLGDKTVSQTKPQQPNISTSFGLVDVGTNAPMASMVAEQSGAQRNQLNPVFNFMGDLDPEFMSIKVTQGSNSISSRTLGVGV